MRTGPAVALLRLLGLLDVRCEGSATSPAGEEGYRRGERRSGLQEQNKLRSQRPPTLPILNSPVQQGSGRRTLPRSGSPPYGSLRRPRSRGRALGAPGRAGVPIHIWRPDVGYRLKTRPLNGRRGRWWLQPAPSMERRQMMVTRDLRQIDLGQRSDSGRGQRQARRGKQAAGGEGPRRPIGQEESFPTG